MMDLVHRLRDEGDHRLADRTRHESGHEHLGICNRVGLWQEDRRGRAGEVRANPRVVEAYFETRAMEETASGEEGMVNG